MNKEDKQYLKTQYRITNIFGIIFFVMSISAVFINPISLLIVLPISVFVYMFYTYMDIGYFNGLTNKKGELSHGNRNKR